MALSMPPASIAALRASRTVTGSRGVPTRIVLDVNDALAPCVEGIALSQDVAASVERILVAAGAGSRHAVLNETSRLGYLALRYGAEFRRLAADIEGPSNDAA